jgi:hypothetical protein
MYVLLYCGVCTGVRLLPPGENPIAVRNNNNKLLHGTARCPGDEQYLHVKWPDFYEDQC